MRFSLFNTRIYISFLFLAVISIFLMVDKTGLFLPMVIAAAIHEMGHLLFMWIFGCQPKEINLVPGSVQIVSSYCSTNSKNNLIYLSGPLFNLMVFVTLYINYLFFFDNSFLNFAFVNLLLGVFNLLPVKGLDGGNVLYNALFIKCGIKKADSVMNVITITVAVVLIFVAVTLSLYGKTNISAYILSVYLILSVILKF